MLLIPGEFIGAAGFPLPFKIECDRMSVIQWEVIAQACLPKLPPFGKVISVPRGGNALAKIMKPYITPKAETILIVDDVWSTGASMRKVVASQVIGKGHRDWRGLVAFSRGPRPINVVAFMQLLV